MSSGIARIRKVVSTAFLEMDERGKGWPMHHRAEFRASSGGICPRDIALTTWVSKSHSPPTEEWRLESLLYTNMGTAAHATVQAFLGYHGLLYGSWECKDCKKIWLNCLSPRVCCGQMPEYIEYSLVHPNPLIGIDGGEYGHCDGIIPTPWGYDYLALEIKSVSLGRQTRVVKDGPFEEHLDQVSVYGEFFNCGYCAVRKRGKSTLKHHRGRILWDKPAVLPPGECAGVMMIYIPRDNPRIRNWTPFFRKIKRGGLARLEKTVPNTMRRISKGILPPGHCNVRADACDEYWRWCPWVEVCFSPSRDEIVAKLQGKRS